MVKLFFIGFWALMSVSFSYARFIDSLSIAPLTIANETDERQVYMIDLNRWAYSDLSYRIDNGPLLHKRTGEFLPYWERDYPFVNSALIRISLEPGQVLKGEVKRIQIPYHGPPPYSEEVIVLEEEQVVAKLWNYVAFSLIACSVLLFIFIYNFIFFSVTRNRLYRFYLPSVLFIMVESMRETGLLTHLFADWERYPVIERYFGSSMTLLFLVSMSFFMRDLLKLPTRFPKINRLFFVYIIASVLVYIITWIDYRIAVDIIVFVLPIFLAIQLYVAGLNLIQKYKYGREIFSVVIVMTIATVIHIIGISGWFDVNENLFANMRSISIIVVDTIMAFILGKIVWDLRQENTIQQEQIIHSLEEEQASRLKIALSVSEIQEKERHDFALRLADELQNQFVAIRYSLLGLHADPPKDAEALTKRREQLLDFTEESILRVEDIAFDIMPASLAEQDSFFHAIDIYLDHLKKKGIQVLQEVGGEHALPLQIRTLAFRIVQELVKNAIQHAEAKKISVRISHQDQVLNISVEDDGKGMAESYLPPQGSGLDNIKSNILMYGGRFSIVPREQGGTRFTVLISTQVDEKNLFSANLN